ncbi:UNVERIFIED_CONTAM: hypothetical protein Slati_1453400 [Sesamum latifolium]|uniref:Integrase catalytic domain-containing protein n=1 Tax=Sesamum latifolium TaxID=2727402 RepID=A0AAW2X668_9LAMI
MKIQQNFTSVANPQANGQVEIVNRIILQHLKTHLEGLKGRSYHTTPRNSTGEPPFFMIYRSKPVIPVEIGMESTRVQMYAFAQCEMDLIMLPENRELAYTKVCKYQKHIKKMYIRR